MFFQTLETGIGYNTVLWFQSWRTDFISALFLPFTYLINEVTLLFLLPLVYWCIHKNFGKRLIQIMLVSSLVNTWFKTNLARPRPYQVTVPGKQAVKPALKAPDSYGIPSGHTQGGVTLFGFLAREIKNRSFTIVMIVLMILTGVSRLIHGVHYPQDILAGAVLGVIIIFIYPSLQKAAGIFLKNLALPAQTFFALLLLTAVLLIFKAGKHDINAFNSYASLASIFSFGLIGFSLESRFIRFSTRGSFIKKFLRFLTGIILSFAIYLGLKFIFHLFNADGEPTMAIILRILRYALLGLWISAGAPALFIKLGLARRE